MTEVKSSQAILITGASSGIGKACALHFARLGFTVFAGVRAEADALALHQLASGDLRPIQLDVTSRDQIESAFEEVAKGLAEKRLAGLVNNAGIPLGGPLEFLSLDDFRREIEVNLVGVVAITQTFLPLIRKATGRIVNVSSTSGFIAMPFMSPYAATKFGLRALTDSLRVEVRPWGISVSIVDVGDVHTRLWEKALAVIERSAEQLPQAGWDLYGPVLQIRERFRPHGISPFKVAEVVERAITARKPRARYVVGRDAKVMDVLRRLPIPIRDALLASQLPDYGPKKESHTT